MQGQTGELRRSRRVVARVAEAVFAASVLLAGVVSMGRDIADAFGGPDRGVFPPDFSEQVRRVEAIAPPRAGLLLVAAPDHTWRARLWQRALYPRNPVVVRYTPLPSGEELADLRRTARFVLALDDAAPDLPLASREGLGGAGRDAAWIGVLAP